MRQSTKELQYDFTGLHNFVRFVDSANKYVVKVGIFGNKNSRTEAGKFSAKLGHRRATKDAAAMTNAEIGLVHELGSRSQNIPQRSFLRMPISMKSEEILKDATKGAAELLAHGNVRQILARLGIACVKWIQIAFGTWGFGQWPPNTLSTVERKGSNSPLIDTAQLRRSITSKVDER